MAGSCNSKQSGQLLKGLVVSEQKRLFFRHLQQFSSLGEPLRGRKRPGLLPEDD